MPHIVQGSLHDQSVDLTGVSYDYDYPDDLDLRPGSDLHKKIVTEVTRRATESYHVTSRKFSKWREIDRTLTTYIPADEEEQGIVSKDSRKPVSIIFPYSYAILETLMAYLTSIFLQSPIFKYIPVSPEDTIGTILLEKIIEKHCERFKVGLALHTMIRDALVYGVGAVSPQWEEMWGFKRMVIDNPLSGEKVPLDVESLLFEGNSLSNIDPYLLLPDPNVSITDQQRGEFIGWVNKTNLMDLLQSEKTDDDIFNIKYLKHMKGMRSSVYGSDPSDREKRFGGTFRDSYDTTNPVDVVYMYIKLLPKEWKLGKEDRPVKWLFGVANDSVVIKARPASFNHNMFPIGITAPDFDGYSTSPLSRIESLYGLQKTLDFLFNSHIANVRKAVNDVIIYDPWLLNGPDLEDPKPGKLVRTRKPAWGKGVEGSVKQLMVNDITRANVEDSSLIAQWMQKIGGADDSLMGAVRQGGPERLTKGEFQGTRAGTASRLDRLARTISMQAMQDIGYMFASHTQQLMSKEMFVTATGRWQRTLLSEFGDSFQGMKVTPFDLLIDYDVEVSDGSVPGGNFSESWLDLFQTLAQSPELQQHFDVGRIFKHIARGLGAKNVDDFVRMQPAIMPDAQVQQAVQAGNIIPMEGYR